MIRHFCKIGVKFREEDFVVGSAERDGAILLQSSLVGSQVHQSKENCTSAHHAVQAFLCVPSRSPLRLGVGAGTFLFE